MELYRPLRAGLFIYDLIRLFFLIGMSLFFMSPRETKSGLDMPFLIHTAPNALFPLMTFFLLISFGEYRSYLFLYMAGKFIAIAAVLGWAAFSLEDLFSAVLTNSSAAIIAFGAAILLAALDGLSILGCLALTRGGGHPLTGTPPPGEEGASQAGDPGAENSRPENPRTANSQDGGI